MFDLFNEVTHSVPLQTCWMIANSQGQVILVTFLFSEEVNRQHVCQASLVVTFLFLTKTKKLLATHAAKSNTNCISKLNVYYYFSTALILVWSCWLRISFEHASVTEYDSCPMTRSSSFLAYSSSFSLVGKFGSIYSRSRLFLKSDLSVWFQAKTLPLPSRHPGHIYKKTQQRPVKLSPAKHSAQPSVPERSRTCWDDSDFLNIITKHRSWVMVEPKVPFIGLPANEKFNKLNFKSSNQTSPQVFFRKRLLCPCRHSKPHKQTGKQAQCQLIQGLQSLKQSIAFGLVFLQ